MNFIKCAFAFLLIAFGSTSRADFIISVGSHDVLANTANQSIDLFLTSTSNSDPQVSGINFRAVLGDGTGNQGVFTGAEGTLQGTTFTGGGYFWDQAASSGSGESPVTGFPAVADASWNFAAPRTVGTLAPVKIATIKIDTTGLFAGTFAIDLLDIASIGVGATELLIPAPTPGTAAPGAFQIINGSFTITAVPEPGTMVLVGLIAAGGGAVRFVRRRRAVR